MKDNTQYFDDKRDLEREKFEEFLTTIKTDLLTVHKARDIENVMGLDERECAKLFYRYFKMTPMQYVRENRIKMVCYLLTNTEKSVTEICQECDSNMSTLGQQFKRITNQTPLEYRRNHLRTQSKR